MPQEQRFLWYNCIYRFMKILYTGTLDVNAGGPAFSTYHTMRGLKDLGVRVELLSFELSEKGKLIGDDVPIRFA